MLAERAARTARAVTYEGRLDDGTVFDRRGSNSSRMRALAAGMHADADPCHLRPSPSCDDGTTLMFEVGAGRVIRAWDVGVATMRVGERARLVCRADYSYGDAGSAPDVPPRRVRLRCMAPLPLNAHPALICNCVRSYAS